MDRNLVLKGQLSATFVFEHDICFAERADISKLSTLLLVFCSSLFEESQERSTTCWTSVKGNMDFYWKIYEGNYPIPR